LLRPAANEANANYDQAPFHQLWKQFTDSFKAKFPTLQAVNQEVKIIEIAEKAGLQRFYDSHYRTYCQYTHGTLRASAGYLDDVTDPADNRTMALCTFVALDALISLGAESPNRNDLFHRVSKVSDFFSCRFCDREPFLERCDHSLVPTFPRPFQRPFRPRLVGVLIT
jgi:hypothetical protein